MNMTSQDYYTRKIAGSILILLTLISGCSTSFSTLKSDNQDVLYQIDERQAFQLSQAAILKTMPGRKITEINGTVKGYSTYTRFGLDKYSQQILIYPASGVTSEAEPVSGFYFEVSGAGTSGSGRAKNVALWESLLESLENTATKVAVNELTLTAYASDNPFEQKEMAQGDSLDVYAKLEKLKDLHDQGALTDAEYMSKKAPLVDQL